VALFRAGWHNSRKDYTQAPEHREKDNTECNSGEPGVSSEVCDSLATRKIAMIGSDTWG
jgi:kynurenine formamidase